jgi:hypothetical protein
MLYSIEPIVKIINCTYSIVEDTCMLCVLTNTIKQNKTTYNDFGYPSYVKQLLHHIQRCVHNICFCYSTLALCQHTEILTDIYWINGESANNFKFL